MGRGIRIAGFAVSISLLLLLSSCGALKPLLTEEEVLSSLSERYRTDFVILETIDHCGYRTEDETIRCRLYLAAPAGNQECSFWVHSTVSKHWGGDSLPMRYSRGISDTYAFDYFLERFDTLLTENEIDHFFTADSGKVEVAEHLKSQHLQYGEFVILITQETAEDIVTKVLEIREQIADEYPLSSYLDYFSHPAYMPIRLGITFCDKNQAGTDGKPASCFVRFTPYDKKFDENDHIVYRDNVETLLSDIDKTIYGMGEEGNTNGLSE